MIQPRPRPDADAMIRALTRKGVGSLFVTNSPIGPDARRDDLAPETPVHDARPTEALLNAAADRPRQQSDQITL